jgi:hypothetical protein
VPSVNAFIAVTGVDDNVAFFKLTAGPGTTAQNANVSVVGPMQLKAHPNPFKGTVAISCQLSAVSKKTVPIEIFSVSGRMVTKLIANSQKLKAGITWNASHLPGGIYLVRLETENKTVTKQVMLLK